MMIVIEGPDNSGKTTQANRLLKLLINLGYSAKLLREPGGTVLGENLRSILLTQEASPETMSLLFAASRRHMMETHVIPALERGEIVILDRFFYSQLVYQEIDEAINATLCRFSSMGYDADVKIMLSPIGNYERREGSEPVNAPDQDTINRGYAEIAQKDRSWFVIDHNIEDEVFEQVVEIVFASLPLVGAIQ